MDIVCAAQVLAVDSDSFNGRLQYAQTLVFPPVPPFHPMFLRFPDAPL